MRNRRRFHYVYYSYEPWGRGYIGKRTCYCKPEDDTKYFGSFSDKTFNPTEKIILSVFETSEEALEAEMALHDFYCIHQNAHFANRAKQTSKFFNTEGVPKSREHKEKIRRSNLGQKRSEEAKQKMSLAKMGNKHCIGKRNGAANKGRTGRKLTPEERTAKALISHRPKYRLELIDPNGISSCPLNMRLFCEEKNLDHTALRKIAQGRGNFYKGWTARLCC